MLALSLVKRLPGFQLDVAWQAASETTRRQPMALAAESLKRGYDVFNRCDLDTVFELNICYAPTKILC